MSSHGDASTANDPRQPSAAKPFVPQSVAPQDLPVDYSGFIAVMFGVAGVMLRYKLCSWVAIIFCAQSLANMRNFETDLKQVSMAMILEEVQVSTRVTESYSFVREEEVIGREKDMEKVETNFDGF